MGTKWHLRSKRKPTGGRLRRIKKKKKIDRGSKFLETKIDERKTKVYKKRGGDLKIKLLSSNSVSVSAHVSGKIKKA